MDKPILRSKRLESGAIGRALEVGWRTFIMNRSISVTYAMVFAVIGLLTLFAVEHMQTAPMALPLAGGFMLLGPVLLVGYFRIADIASSGGTPRIGDAVSGFGSAPKDIWAIAAVAMLFYLIWITDAATLYGFMVGNLPTPLAALLPLHESVIGFVLWSSLMGCALAFVIFAITAFSVPLLYYRRTGLIAGIIASVKAVFGNLPIAVGWGGLLAVSVIGAILVLPLFLIIFPVMAYASHALYRELFPDPGA